jgi:hypothetical protein
MLRRTILALFTVFATLALPMGAAAQTTRIRSVVQDSPCPPSVTWRTRDTVFSTAVTASQYARRTGARACPIAPPVTPPRDTVVPPVAPPPVTVPPVTPPPISSAMAFTSDWSTATGTSQAALLDGGKWTRIYCQQHANTATIVAGAPLGWTKTSNVLRLQQLGETECGTLEKVDLLPASTSHYGRMYFRNDEIGTQHNHVATYNPGVGAPIQLAFWNRNGSASGVAIFLRTYFSASGQGSAYPLNFWAIGTPNRPGMDRLSNGAWYRYEWHMEYVTPRTYRIWPRIYDMAGTLLYDATRFFQNDYPQSGTHSLATWYAAGNTFGLTDPQLARRLGLGNEGPATSGRTGGFWYHADVAISTTGWIGR